jgi:hypothetical protein
MALASPFLAVSSEFQVPWMDFWHHTTKRFSFHAKQTQEPLPLHHTAGTAETHD